MQKRRQAAVVLPTYRFKKTQGRAPGVLRALLSACKEPRSQCPYSVDI